MWAPVLSSGRAEGGPSGEEGARAHRWGAGVWKAGGVWEIQDTQELERAQAHLSSPVPWAAPHGRPSTASQTPFGKQTHLGMPVCNLNSRTEEWTSGVLGHSPSESCLPKGR